MRKEGWLIPLLALGLARPAGAQVERLTIKVEEARCPA
jgi:hypothetical protein